MYTYKIIIIYKSIENQPISNAFNVINKVVILRNFNPIHKCRNKSQNPLFKKTKKLAQFPKQKPHLHQIWRCWAPDIHSRQQTEELLWLASQTAVWLQFSSYVIWWNREHPTPRCRHPASLYQFCISAPSIKINIFAHKD